MNQTQGRNCAVCQNLLELRGCFGALAPAEVSQAALVNRVEIIELRRPSRFKVFHCLSWIALDYRAQHRYPLVLDNCILRKFLVEQFNGLQHGGPFTGASENRGHRILCVSSRVELERLPREDLSLFQVTDDCLAVGRSSQIVRGALWAPMAFGFVHRLLKESPGFMQLAVVHGHCRATYEQISAACPTFRPLQVSLYGSHIVFEERDIVLKRAETYRVHASVEGMPQGLLSLIHSVGLHELGGCNGVVELRRGIKLQRLTGSFERLVS